MYCVMYCHICITYINFQSAYAIDVVCLLQLYNALVADPPAAAKYLESIGISAEDLSGKNCMPPSSPSPYIGMPHHPAPGKCC